MEVAYDRVSRVLFWGGVSFILASLGDLLGLAAFWTTFLAAWGASAATYLGLASLKHPAEGKAVLITGCDSGFGYATALFLDKMGFRVFAGCLLAASGGDGAQRLRREGSQRLHVLQLDVTSQKQIQAALEEVKRLLPKKEVFWGLVNNAGVNPYGAVEWVSLEAYRNTAEVNLFGAVAVTKTFLPLIRRAKGRVVNVGSVRGRMPCPLGAAYDITKFGIEAFNDALRNELRRFGVKVSLIEPGNFTLGTGIFTQENIHRFSKKMWKEMADEIKGDYGKQAFDDAMECQLQVSKTGSRDLSAVVDAITGALTQKFPESRYLPMQLSVFIRLFIYQHLPEWIYDYLYY